MRRTHGKNSERGVAMNRSSRSLWLGVVSVLMSISCDEQASVGTDPGDCYSGMRCEDLFFDLSSPDMLNISSREGVEALMPTWTLEELGETSLLPEDDVPASGMPWGTPPLGGLGALGTPPPGVALALGPERGLWVFARAQKHLRAWELEASGTIARDAMIAPPAGVEPMEGADAFYTFCNVQSHEAGPVVTLSWREACTEEDATWCDAPETLVFQENLESEPFRLRGEISRGVSSCAQLALRDSTGDALLIQRYTATQIDKVSLSGETLWEQPLPEQVLWDYGYVLQASLTSSDEWIAGLSAQPTEYSDKHLSDMVFLRANEQGVSLVFAGLAAGIVFLQPLSVRPRTVFDAQGRMIVLTMGGLTDFSQDLWVLRSGLDGSPGKAVTIVREDYLPLMPGPASVDPQGNLYVAMLIGGLRPDRQDAILCEVRESFEEARCFYIDEMPFALQASGAGVVYTASAAGVQRYDLPL